MGKNQTIIFACMLGTALSTPVIAEEFNTDGVKIWDISNLSFTLTSTWVIPVGSIRSPSSTKACTIGDETISYTCQVEAHEVNNVAARRLKANTPMTVERITRDDHYLRIYFSESSISRLSCWRFYHTNASWQNWTVGRFKNCSDALGFLLEPPKVEILDVQ